MNDSPEPLRSADSREILRSAKRVVIKAGTSIVANSNGQPSLTRVGAIVEQISELVHDGTEVIFVSSGAVGMGRRLLRNHGRLKLSVKELHKVQDNADGTENMGIKLDKHLANSGSGGFSKRASLKKDASPESMKHYDSACAAAGQFDLIKFYSSLFSQCDITASQILLTQADFREESNLNNLKYSMERLLSLGIVPIINENDAVSANIGYTDLDIFSDNDSLASNCARNFGADVLVILTDVDGVYDKPPSAKGAKLIKFYPSGVGEKNIEIGPKCVQGRGGMSAKIAAAVDAVKPGPESKCNACIIVGGHDLNSIRDVLGPKKETKADTQKGTLFVTPGTRLYDEAIREMLEESASHGRTASDEARAMATASRSEARKLQGLPHEERQAILYSVADALVAKKEHFLKTNIFDLEAFFLMDSSQGKHENASKGEKKNDDITVL